VPGIPEPYEGARLTAVLSAAGSPTRHDVRAYPMSGVNEIRSTFLDYFRDAGQSRSLCLPPARTHFCEEVALT
jgi:hypothetical protein